MRCRIWLAIWAILAIVPAAPADYVSRTYQFDLSNALPTGESFGSVKIEAYNGVGASGGLAAGQVRMTFSANPLAMYGPTDPTFGFSQVGFNSALSINNSQIALSSGFQLRNDRFMGGFGLFHWQAYGTPASGTPLTITISDLGADATVDNFAIGSKTSTGDWPLFGSVFFAGKVGGFDLNNDFFDMSEHTTGVSGSEWPELPDEGGLGGGLGETPVPNDAPEPAALLLGLCGGGVLFIRRMRHPVGRVA